MVYWLQGRGPFYPEMADEHGLVAIGGTIEPKVLLAAYRAGVFPWASDPLPTWWSPDPRAIFDIDTFRLRRATTRAARRGGWRFSVDEDFPAVIRGCARRAPGRRETWITPDFVAAYTELHQRGHAHSVEVWEEGKLIGGLYGVTVGACFAGESMFHRKSEASKAALGHLIERLRACDFELCDAQVPTPHLCSLGAIEIPRSAFLSRLRQALARPARLT